MCLWRRYIFKELLERTLLKREKGCTVRSSLWYAIIVRTE